MTAHEVRALLMGGQACVFYGAAEFSRDVDFAVLADAGNLDRLQGALNELQAEPVFVPPLSVQNLQRGHAVHFRCRHSDALNLRVDLMSKMRGVDDFPSLWQRRTTLTEADGTLFELLSLPDLVKAKKTQRDKDWPMIRRLLEADYSAADGNADDHHAAFWLRELRTPALLITVARERLELCRGLESERTLLRFAAVGDASKLAAGLEAEEKQERELDRLHWRPLRAELESLRHGGAGR